MTHVTFFKTLLDHPCNLLTINPLSYAMSPLEKAGLLSSLLKNLNFVCHSAKVGINSRPSRQVTIFVLKMVLLKDALHYFLFTKYFRNILFKRLLPLSKK
ncbi:MAG TPA: hypothetical protein VEC36_07415 [Patescibacteria group bacterium]|nr:hypothetical protein [Patescibacteria group bacterium]